MIAGRAGSSTRRSHGKGRRIFRMAPLHHHYEKGWKEKQVVVRFWIITMLLVPGRPVDAEAALMELPERRARCSCSASANPGLAMARWCARSGARGARVGLARAAAAAPRRCASTCRRRRSLARRARRRRRSTACDCVLKSPGLAPHDARIAPLLARAARARHPGAGRARPVRARAGRPEGRARLRAEGDRDHRHQRQDDDDGADRRCWSSAPARASRWPATSGRRCCTTLRRGARRRWRAARGLGARALELPARRRRAASSRRRGAAQRHAGPPRLARLDGRLRRGEGAHLRRATRCWSSTATTRRSRRLDAARRRRVKAGAQGRDARESCRARRALRPRRAAARRRLRPRRPRTAWPGWCARCEPTRPRKRRGDAPAAAEELHLQRLMPADALRMRGRHNAANALAALALRQRHRLPAGADAARPARIQRRAAPRRACRDASTASTSSTTARAPTSAPPSPRSTASAPTARRPSSCVILGGDGKGQDFAPLAEPVRAPRARGRDDRPRRGADRGRARADRRADRAPRDARGRDALVLRAGAAGRRGAAEPGLREPRHVPQLRAPRRGVRRRGAGDRADTTGSVGMSALPASCSRWRARQRRPSGRLAAGCTPRRRRRGAARRARCRSATGSASTAASRRACSASTRRWSGSSSRCSRSAW